jgi:hypothetical protein
MKLTSRIPVAATLFVAGLLVIPAQSEGLREGSSAPRGFIQVGPDGRHFVFAGSGARFVPWGFNYDRDFSHRLLESYWKAEWPTVVEDFREMKALGANTVRIHLQLGRFMNSPDEPNRENLGLLARLLSLAEEEGLYLDLTGLGCYDRAEVPGWYDGLEETERWETQARFWEFVAQTCAKSRGVFCYDLMNEPIVTQGQVQTEWTAGALGKFYYVQRINLDPDGREAQAIAKAWIDKLVVAIRKHDPHRLVTVGAIPWALTFPKAKPLFHSPEASESLDFVSVHFYPKSGEMEKALAALAVYDIGKPIVVEEMFPLSCSVDELERFVGASRKLAAGWLGFYWGKTIGELERGKLATSGMN